MKHSLLIVNCKRIFFFPSTDITDNERGLFSQFKTKWQDTSWREIVNTKFGHGCLWDFEDTRLDSQEDEAKA